ncbi:MAG: type IV pilus assembly protein PilM [Candidatus Moraniibacteriota bacterium]
MFGFGKPFFLGIDFGTSSIKVVLLSVKDNRPVLMNYGEVDLGSLERGGVSNQGDYDATVTVYLRSLLDRMKVKTKEAYVAMPAFIGLITLVEFPEMSEQELEEAIRFEAHKYIPSPLEEVALSWEIVGRRESGKDPETGKVSNRIEVLLVAALNKEVERYESYIKSTGCEMQLLELETFSLVRAIVDGDTGVYLVIDIGSRATNLILVEHGLVKVSRNLDIGGKDVTRTITESLSIALDRAEALKKSGKDFLNSPESKLIFPGLQSIGAEAERMMGIYKEKHPDSRFDGIILSGGTAGLVGLPKYFGDMLGVPVSVANPWRTILYDPKLEGAIARMGPSFSVALGLALQGVSGHLKKNTK